MRTLELNKTTMWVVSCLGMEDIYDENGYYTGEQELTYSEPKKIRINLYPATGEVLTRQFGSNVDVDMVSSSTNVVLDKDDLLFYKKPINNYDSEYDFRVTSIMKSLNHYQYGFGGNIE